MKLIIVESPTKARTLSRFLGSDYAVMATVGHVMDLPKSKMAVDVEHDFKPMFQKVPGKDTMEKIAARAKSARLIYLATDPDREGEAIAAHVEELLKKDYKNDSFKRISFHEITKSAVEEAIEHPAKVNKNLVDAQAARRVLDRLVGYTLSPLIWKKVRYGLSAGRVQSAAMRILMERERLIRAFVPENYWTITGIFKSDGLTFPLICEKEPKEEKETNRIISEGEKGNWKVVSVKESDVKKNPYPPFVTSTLQRLASNRLGFSPSRTMRAAQRLYEAGKITYMRTDSVAMSKQAQASILKYIDKNFGKEYATARNFKTRSKNAQEAHECIRPTNINYHADRGGDEARLYELIWLRAVASQMTGAKIKRTKLSANIDGNTIPNFSTVGARIMFDGWLKLDKTSRGEETEVPKLTVDSSLKLNKISFEKKETQPPTRYSEAGLIKELEKRGIGRPSTYASIVRTIEKRGYVDKNGKTLIPTDTGDVVSSFLEKHFADYISDNFTADMENKLDEIAKGEMKYVKVLKEFYDPFEKDVKSKENVDKLTNLGNADKKFKCPKCGSAMIIKLGRSGKFLSCKKYPKCDGSLTIDGEELGKVDELGKHPDTGEPIYLLEGRFGPYVQLGEKTDDNPNPKRASLPKNKNKEDVTLADAVHLLILPRILGKDPKTDEEIIANVGRFGPYVGRGREFRSLKGKDDPYTVSLKRAIEIINKPKSLPKGVTLVRVLGKHPKSGKEIRLLKSKSGLFVQKGLKRLYFSGKKKEDNIKLDDALKLLD